MSASIRLISDDLIIHKPDSTQSKLYSEKNYIFTPPKGKRLIVCFSDERTEIHPLINQAIINNLGVVYVCESLPQNPIIHSNIVYIETPYRWFIHTLFMNPLQFSAVLSTEKCSRLAQAFSEFTGYKIPYILDIRGILSLSENYDKSKQNILVEIIGGVGDHLLTIPSLKTLASKGYNVNILCEVQRNPCFQNLPYIKTVFSRRSDVVVSRFNKIIYLHFGQHLNDYRMELNKQNRIYAIAELCGLNKSELVIDKPEIILTSDEINNAKRKYASYQHKIFFGTDSARVDAKIPIELVQDKINILKSKGFTVFSSSFRRDIYNNCIDLNKKLSIRELFSLISVMDYVLTVDTSFLHIAAAFNKKTFALINYFKPDWRCSTYHNCSVYTPEVSCYPCIAKQFVSCLEWQCNKNSCYDFFNWNKILDDIYNFRLNNLNTKSNVLNKIIVDDITTTEDDIIKSAPGKLIKSINYNIDKKIAAIWLGGIGDSIMLGYLCRAIKDKHPNCSIDAFVRDTEQTSLFIFDYPNIKPKVSKNGWTETLNSIKNYYDIIYEFRRYPYVWYNYSPDLNKKLCSTLYDSWNKASIRILSDWKGKIFDYYANESDLIISGDNLNMPINFLGKNAIDSRLLGYNLPEKYITISPGCDNNVGVNKLWPVSSWESLVQLLSLKGINIVYLGNKYSPNISNLKRIECKDLVDLSLILSKSILNISNEGGSVHIAHSVGTKSVVLFGPTNPTLYGYSDNINIYPDICESCWWTVTDWNKRCKLGNSFCKNLNNISVDDVYNSVIEALK